METLHCEAIVVVYRNDENGYSVIRVKTDNGVVVIVGNLATVAPGCSLVCKGQWVNNPKFGKQFVVESYTERLPFSPQAIESYLGCGLFKGIGPKQAFLIVDKFGENTIDIIESDPDRLLEVEGIGKKKLEKIKASWANHREIRNLMLFLQQYGVSTNLAQKIFRQYGDKSIEVLNDNPYLLADDLFGVGFKTADSIAQKLGYSKEDMRRINAGVLFVMNAHCKEGHVFSTENKLIKDCVEILECSADMVWASLGALSMTEGVVIENGNVYLPMMYRSESGVAERLRFLMSAPMSKGSFNSDNSEVDTDTNIVYDEIQQRAIDMAQTSKVLVLTGGPGTGKTTTLKGIIAKFRSMGLFMNLAAPTGRAAKRMSEATGMPAKTIHRLLEYSPKAGFARNAKNPLLGNVLIVDECSMIDVILMNSLLRAVPSTMRVVLVGDVDQLPSVGAGNVLRDIIGSGVVPVVKLEKIFRQAQSSLIVMNAHAINHGRLPTIDNANSKDFFFINCEDAELMPSSIVSLITRRLPNYYKVSPSDIQVLSPMRRGPAGTDFLNECIQRALNPVGDEVKRGMTTFRVGDRVMQIKNNYDKEVFNGDIGYITNIDTEEDIVRIDYGGGEPVVYERSDLDEITLAYATTIHKSQGSEYPIVIIPVHTTHYIMLQRNLIYTGITRAKKICVLIGTKKALALAVRNNAVLARNTQLIQRLHG